MTRITLQQFDGLSLEERDAYLERREQEECDAALARTIPATPTDAFMAYAVAILELQPSLIFDVRELANEVAKRAIAEGVKQPNDRPYSAKTIYNHVSPRRLELLAAWRGNGSRSS